MKPVTILKEPLTLAIRNNTVAGLKKFDHVRCLQYHMPSNKAWIDDGDISGKKIKWREIPLSSLQYLDNHPNQEIFDEELFRWHMDEAKQLWKEDPLLHLNSVKNPALLQLSYRSLNENDHIQLKHHLSWLVENGAEINTYDAWSNLFATSSSNISYFYHHLWDLSNQGQDFTEEDIEKLYDHAIHRNVFALGFMISKVSILPYEKMLSIHQNHPRHYDENYIETFSSFCPTLPLVHEVVVNLSRYGNKISQRAFEDAQILLPFLFEHNDWHLKDTLGNTVLDIARLRNHDQILSICQAHDAELNRAKLDLETPSVELNKPRSSSRRM